MINDFIMISNQRAFQILSSITSQTFKSQRNEKQKSMILGQFFNLQIFDTFWKFRNRFQHQLKQILNSYQYFGSNTTLSLKF